MIGFNRKNVLSIMLLCATQTALASIAQGGIGAVPAPVHSNGMHFISGEILIEGEHFVKKNASAYWNYQNQYSFYSPHATEVTVQMAQPFLVMDRDLKMSIPKGRFLGQWEPLLYDFIVRVDGNKLKIKSFSSATMHEGPLGFSGAYFWEMPFQTHERRVLAQSYRTGVSFDTKENVLLHFNLRTAGLWHVEKNHRLHVEVWPNAPTRLCHELKKGAPIPRPAGLQVVGDKSHRHYVWDLAMTDIDKDLHLCFQTTNTYIHSRVVAPILEGDKNEAMGKMALSELTILRNTIYAQYGRIFSDEKLQHHFSSLWWYEPNPKFSARVLTREDLKALRSIDFYEREKFQSLTTKK